MRMWTVHPRLLCRVHLLGEHVELHMAVGAMLKGETSAPMRSLLALCRRGYVNPEMIPHRHSTLVREMERRGFTHNSPIETFRWPRRLGRFTIDRLAAYQDLFSRCEKCQARAIERPGLIAVDMRRHLEELGVLSTAREGRTT